MRSSWREVGVQIQLVQMLRIVMGRSFPFRSVCVLPMETEAEAEAGSGHAGVSR